MRIRPFGPAAGGIACHVWAAVAHRCSRPAQSGLDRLEERNRWAVFLSFPLLTAGVLADVVLLLRGSEIVGWADPRMPGTLGLGGVFAVLLYLHLSQHLRGRQVARRSHTLLEALRKLFRLHD